MELETMLSALAINFWYRHGTREGGAEVKRRLRQYRALHDRILRMDAEGRDCIAMLREERNQLREALTILYGRRK